MRRHWARGQLWALAYFSVRHVFGLIVTVSRSEASKDAELLALRHEVASGARWGAVPTSPPIARFAAAGSEHAICRRFPGGGHK
jgi:hypothetical protein